MHRFFVPPRWIAEDIVIIRGRLLHQLRNVLRLVPGDRIIVLDDSGWEYEAELVVMLKEEIRGAIKGKRLVLGEPFTKIILYQALLKANKFDLVLQKGTEIGVTGFVPLLCDRCVVSNLVRVDEDRTARWQRIIREAAEQSRRAKLPTLYTALPFRQACQSASGISLLPWEEERVLSLRAALRRIISEGALVSDNPQVNIFVGPEGGFSLIEVEFAQDQGVLPVTLGSRLLRSETAGLVAATAILYELGDLGDSA